MASHPKLRPLEAFPVEVEGEEVICLRDPAGITENVALVPRPVVALLTLFDGTRTVTEIQKDFVRLRGELLPREAIEGLVAQLDEALLLESRRFQTHQARVTAEFLAAPARAAAHAGVSYPADEAELRRLLDGYFDDPAPAPVLAPAPAISNGTGGGDGLGHEAPAVAAAKPRAAAHRARGAGAPAAPRRAAPGLCAIVAPHIDFARGGPLYAQAYRPLLDEVPPDLYVVLGTDHNGDGALYSLTAKSFETPLGIVETDAEAVAAIGRRTGGAALLQSEINHRREHSIEFQAVLLRYVAARRRDDRAPVILPILCGSFHEFIEGDLDPAEDARIADLCAAVAEVTRGRRVVYVAGADLAHVGPHFGDDAPLGDDALERLARGDHALLESIAAADANAFYARLLAEQDRRRVCGLPPIYTMLRMCGAGAAGEVLGYDQCPAGTDEDSRVSIAAVVLRGV